MANGSPGGGAAGSFEQRLQALEDEREIRELIVRYAQRLDARDHRGYAQLFAREGRWSGRMGDATGPEAIESMLTEGLGQPPDGFRNTRNFHLMSNGRVHAFLPLCPPGHRKGGGRMSGTVLDALEAQLDQATPRGCSS